ncbi:MAG: amidohydrolase family protein [Acidobacteria bacterium]|nr:amidohydrolase family protein [Acidobacteriota bacterium]
MLRIDAHHHLWLYNVVEYGWLEGDLAPLRRDFVVENLIKEAARANVTGTVAVQARQSIEETDWLLKIAESAALIHGVVGWLPLREPQFPALLEGYREQPLLKGLRHVVQGEQPGFMDDPAFLSGMASLTGSGLTYDILIFEQQLEEAIRLVDRFPEQVFVLDHIGKPCISAGELHPWADRIRELARRGNVYCKLSGMITEANPQRWTSSELKPFFEIVLEAFSPSRLMAGTDWPVLLVGCSYENWWALLSEWVGTLSTGEQAWILGLTAAGTYHLTVAPQTERKMNGADA